MTDIPKPAVGDTSWDDWATDEEAMSDRVREIDAQTLDVKEYGATGDGTTDDTASIQNAVDALISAGGGTLYFPPGKYRLTGTVYINPTSEVTPIRLLGEFTDAASTMGTGTVFYKTTAGDMMRVNVNSSGNPAVSALFSLYSVAFEGLAFEGTDAATTYGIRAYRSRISMKRITAYKLDGLMMQDRTSAYTGFDNYCDQGLYEDIRFAAPKNTAMSLSGCDSTTFNRISYQYPSTGAVYGIRLYRGTAATINGFLYADGNHNAAATMLSVIEAEGCSGLTVNGVHIEEPDAQRFFDIKSSFGVSFNGIHTRFRTRTLFKFDDVRGVKIDAWNGWSDLDATYYDIDAASNCLNISYRGLYVAAFNIGSQTNTRLLVVNDPSKVVWEQRTGLSPLVARMYLDTSTTLTTFEGGRTVDINAASPVTITVPPVSSQPFPEGTTIKLVQYGAGQITLAAGSGVALRSQAGLKSAGQYAEITLTLRTGNEWMVTGQTTV